MGEKYYTRRATWIFALLVVVSEATLQLHYICIYNLIVK